MPSSRENGPGRPRSPLSRKAILDATRELVHEHGLAAVSVTQIATRASSSTATIYRWWPDKAALALDAFLDTNQPIAALRDTGDLIADLTAELDTVAVFYTTSDDGKALLQLIAEAQHNPELATRLHERFFAPAYTAIATRLQAARAAGQMREGYDLDLIANVIGGGLYNRLLVTGQPIPSDFARQVIGFLAPALAPPHDDSND